MDGTLQEHGSCWVGLLAGHGAHGAGACRSLCVEAEFRHRGQPGHHARTCPLNRQGIAAAAAHPHAYFSKGCSGTASCYCSICGAVRHTQAHTHIHTLTRMRMRKHIQTQTRAHIAHILTGANTHIHMHTLKHRHTRAHKHTHKHTGTHTHAYTRAHTHTHTCISTHTLST